MKLRFDIDQADCLLNGIDAPTSTVTIEVDPQDIPPQVRPLIAARLHAGIHVVQLWNSNDGTIQMVPPRYREISRIMAKRATLPSLVQAVIENEEMKCSREARHHGLAMGLALRGVDLIELAKASA